MKKGFTLIEVILAITLISIISISFIPGITFGYKHLINSKKYTEDIFFAQKEIEEVMEKKRNETLPGEELEKTIFGMKVKGHNIELKVGEHGEVNVFQPKKEYIYEEPKIIRDVNSGISNIVRLSVLNKTSEILPIPQIIQMYKSNNLLDLDLNFLVDKKYYKIDKPKIFLVNVFRWYTSSTIDYSEDFIMDNYRIIKEWNAARELISYEESKSMNMIPNIQNNPDYNRLRFDEVKSGLNLNDADFINQYGNRYYYFSVTPFAISGKIGKEEFSNSVYVEAPRIEIDKAIYGPAEDQVSIYFKASIQDVFVIDKMSFNENLGNIISVSRDLSSDKIMILKFDKALDTDINMGGNVLNVGSVFSSVFGGINIWYNDSPSGEFTIYDVPPVPVNSIDIVDANNLNIDNLDMLKGQTYQLKAIARPEEATNKEIIWTSSDTDIVSVSSSGMITGKSSGTATIRATSADNPTKHDVVTVSVKTEAQVLQELKDILNNIDNLEVQNPRNRNSDSSRPQIKITLNDGEIVYTFSASSANGDANIQINSGNKTATITRSANRGENGTITLKASKNVNGTIIENTAEFGVSIPVNGTRNNTVAVTITGIVD